MARDPRLKLLEGFLDQLAHQRRLSPGTARNYARALEELFALTDGVPLEKLEPRHMRRAVSELHARGISGRTIAYRLSGWRGFFNWLIKHRGFSHNPCARSGAIARQGHVRVVLLLRTAARRAGEPRCRGRRRHAAAG